jgi:hypothetical protein
LAILARFELLNFPYLSQLSLEDWQPSLLPAYLPLVLKSQVALSIPGVLSLEQGSLGNLGR